MAGPPWVPPRHPELLVGDFLGTSGGCVMRGSSATSPSLIQRPLGEAVVPAAPPPTPTTPPSPWVLVSGGGVGSGFGSVWGSPHAQLAGGHEVVLPLARLRRDGDGRRGWGLGFGGERRVPRLNTRPCPQNPPAHPSCCLREGVVELPGCSPAVPAGASGADLVQICGFFALHELLASSGGSRVWWAHEESAGIQRTAPSWWLRWEKGWEEAIPPAQQVEKLRHRPVGVRRGCR